MNRLPRDERDFSPGMRHWVTCRTGRTDWATIGGAGNQACLYSAPATIRAEGKIIKGVVLTINGETHFVANGDDKNRGITEGYVA